MDGFFGAAFAFVTFDACISSSSSSEYISSSSSALLTEAGVYCTLRLGFFGLAAAVVGTSSSSDSDSRWVGSSCATAAGRYFFSLFFLDFLTTGPAVISSSDSVSYSVSSSCYVGAARGFLGRFFFGFGAIVVG